MHGLHKAEVSNVKEVAVNSVPITVASGMLDAPGLPHLIIVGHLVLFSFSFPLQGSHFLLELQSSL
ncbi:hypothetical protein [Tissierella sp.]|uniref:hypothetical protein n=1 Tax=Tissierella sp. TaxID=41274 RepID=UPI003F9D7129